MIYVLPVQVWTFYDKCVLEQQHLPSNELLFNNPLVLIKIVCYIQVSMDVCFVFFNVAFNHLVCQFTCLLSPSYLHRGKKKTKKTWKDWAEVCLYWLGRRGWEHLRFLPEQWLRPREELPAWPVECHFGGGQLLFINMFCMTYSQLLDMCKTTVAYGKVGCPHQANPMFTEMLGFSCLSGFSWYNFGFNKWLIISNHIQCFLSNKTSN